jgi:hypothetical protein
VKPALVFGAKHIKKYLAKKMKNREDAGGLVYYI